LVARRAMCSRRSGKPFSFSAASSAALKKEAPTLATAR
jgi:hypothetical protein